MLTAGLRLRKQIKLFLFCSSDFSWYTSILSVMSGKIWASPAGAGVEGGSAPYGSLEYKSPDG